MTRLLNFYYGVCLVLGLGICAGVGYQLNAILDFKDDESYDLMQKVALSQVCEIILACLFWAEAVLIFFSIYKPIQIVT